MLKYFLIYSVLFLGVKCFFFDAQKVPDDLELRLPLKTKVSNFTLEELKKNRQFNRDQAIECVLTFVDGLKIKIDKFTGEKEFYFDKPDGCVDLNEILAAKERYLLSWELLATKIVKSEDQIMWDCDNDTKAKKRTDTSELLKGCITLEDMEFSIDHCIHTQTDLYLLRDKV